MTSPINPSVAGVDREVMELARSGLWAGLRTLEGMGATEGGRISIMRMAVARLDEALTTPSTAPEGGEWRTVPVKITPEMILAGYAAFMDAPEAQNEDFKAAWSAMLAVAPQPKPDERLAKAMEALREVRDLPKLSEGAMSDDFDRGARAARLEARDIAAEALRYLEVDQ